MFPLLLSSTSTILLSLFYSNLKHAEKYIGAVKRQEFVYAPTPGGLDGRSLAWKRSIGSVVGF